MGRDGKSAVNLLRSAMRKHLALLGLIVLGIGPAAGDPLRRDVIPDAASAIKVARVFFETYTGRPQERDFEATLDGDTWYVVSTLPPPFVEGRDDPAKYPFSFGGASMALSKHDGRVLDIGLAR